MVDHGPLFGWLPPPPSAPKPIEQDEQLRRVVSGIGVHVLAFLRTRLLSESDRVFHLTALNTYVAEHAKCAPDSPRRVMGELKKQGWCVVELLSRSDSLYRVHSVEGT